MFCKRKNIHELSEMTWVKNLININDLLSADVNIWEDTSILTDPNNFSLCVGTSHGEMLACFLSPFIVDTR